jgi:hypothetical protein
MKTASTWDIVCAANQHLRSSGQAFWINQFMPETYEILTADQSGTVSAKRRIGKTMNEQQVRLFIQQIVYA